ncbi:hypothetical protein BDF19DRAFT_436166 [Syncephalis fuscata]|nr:hypothetical protein BDF19DRAFT_436166 [Syncephalis fuscata]
MRSWHCWILHHLMLIRGSCHPWTSGHPRGTRHPRRICHSCRGCRSCCSCHSCRICCSRGICNTTGHCSINRGSSYRIAEFVDQVVNAGSTYTRLVDHICFAKYSAIVFFKIGNSCLVGTRVSL